MSDWGDSFAESGLMRSRWATSSTSDLESVDLTRSNQHSTSLSVDQAMTLKLKQFKFKLAWATRDEIVSSLNQHTKLLSGLNFKADVREKMRKVNNELVTTLMNLPMKVDCQSRSSKSFESESDDGLTELVLDLSMEVRSRIVDALTINQSISLMDSHSIASELKSNLIDRNNELISELYKLRARAIPGNSSKGDALIDLAKMREPQTSDNVVNEKVLGELDKSDLTAEEVTILKDELEKLKLQAERMDVKNEVTISLEFKGIEAVLAGGPDEQSEYFACGGFFWYVKISHSLIDESEYLTACLYRKSIPNDVWSVMATFEFRFLPLFGSDMIYTTKTLPFKSGKNYWRFFKFISVKELRSGPFIRDDKIKLQMKMSVKSVEKIAN